MPCRFSQVALSVTKFRGTEVEERLHYVLNGGTFHDDEHWENLQFIRGKKKKKRERIDYAKELETLAQTKQRKHKSRNASWLVQQSGIQAEKD